MSPLRQPSVLIVMLQESGHLNPTFPLAKQLRARGMEVSYIVAPHLAESVERQGFPTAVLSLLPDVHAGTHGMLARRRAITRRYVSLLEELSRNTEMLTPLIQNPPDLMLIDVTQTQFAFWARRAQVPFVYLNSSLPQTKEPGVPPLRSAAPYRDDLVGFARSELLWSTFLAKRRLVAEVASRFGMCPPYDLARRAVKAFGLSEDEINCDTVYMPQLHGVPELVLCHQTFDFPRSSRPGLRYVATVDLERQEPEFGWSCLSSQKPLVYCALGGQLYRKGDTPGFFRRVIEAFRLQPDWQLLLAVGQHMRPEELTSVPENVAVVVRAPQLAVLRRARAMITHGGLNSVKECIASGVPMLVFPLDVDQPGNAARVEHHGLGLRGDVAKTSTEQLTVMLRRCLDDAEFSARCRQMASAWQAARASSELEICAVVDSAMLDARALPFQRP